MQMARVNLLTRHLILCTKRMHVCVMMFQNVELPIVELVERVCYIIHFISAE